MSRQKKIPLTQHMASDDVPYERRGSPLHSARRPTGEAWGNWIGNRGDKSWQARLRSLEWIADYFNRWNSLARSELEERALLQAWDFQNNNHLYDFEDDDERWLNATLYKVLGEDRALLQRIDAGTCGRKEVEQIAATLIQWLGTNIGSGLLEHAKMIERAEREEVFKLAPKRKLLLQALSLLPLSDKELRIEDSENSDGAGI